MSDEPATPLTFDVHLFPVVRLKVPGVLASSHVEAVERALEQVGAELQECLASSGVEYAEEISHYLVDVAGDSDYLQSRWFYAAEDPLLTFLRRLAAWDESGRDAATLHELITDVRAHLACIV